MYGPAVRRKRFSSSCRFAVSHQCIRPLIGAVLRATMDISAPAFSLPARPQVGHLGHSFRMRREDRSSISSHPLADLGGKRDMLFHHRLLLRSSSSVRAMRPFLRPGLPLISGAARRGRQAWPSR
jgi:hypothetical protein